MRLFGIALTVLAFIIPAAVPLPAQERNSDVPVIIRDTDIAEGVEEEVIPKERDPDKAKENLEVGDFYYKQKNYVGALGRYLTALEYQPDSEKAYKAFVKACESYLKSFDISPDEVIGETNQIDQALDSIQEYLRNNPGSPRREEFLRRLEQLRDKVPQAEK